MYKDGNDAMKLEKIWIAICLILVTGLLSTSYVKRLVTVSPGEILEMASTENTELARLKEVDRQLEAGRQEDRKMASGARSLGAGQETETWQAQLERQLEVLEEALGQQEAQELFDRQMAWTREWEQQSEDNAEKLAEGEMTWQEFDAFQAEKIRGRCYALAAQYPGILGDTQ